MSDSVRWLVAVVAAVLIIGLIAYGGGPEHHRGTDVGVHASAVPALGGDLG
jgi:hypothetical protein